MFAKEKIMMIRSKILSLVLCVATAFSATVMGLAASGGDPQTGANVSDERWVAMLDFQPSQYDSYTYVSHSYDLYDKSQAEERGGWEDVTLTIKIDRKNRMYHSNINGETYDYSQDGPHTIHSFSDSDEYIYPEDSAYYSYEIDRQTPTYSVKHIFSKTEGEVDEIFDRDDSLYVLFRMYAHLRFMFTYNDKTGAYECSTSDAVSTSFLSVKFTEGGVIILSSDSEMGRTIEIEIKDLNKTVVSVPNNVKDEVRDYFAEHPQQ